MSLLILFLCGTAVAAFAQRPVITNAPRSVPAGVDFASDVLSDPWDFSNEEDLSQYPYELRGWTTSGDADRYGRRVFLRDGHFVARTERGGGNRIPLLFRGGHNVITSETERTGKHDHWAIPTSRYGKLAVHMTMSASTGGQLAAFWFDSPHGTPGERGRGMGFSRPQQGTRIYIADLVTGIWTDRRGNAGTPFLFPLETFADAPWTGSRLMRALDLRATSDGAAEVDVRIDWVRLTQRDGEPGASVLPIVFDGCNSHDYSVEVESAANEWDVVHTGVAGAGPTTANVNYGVLPPGDWTLRVTCYPVSRVPEGGAGVSSAPVTISIDAPPSVTVYTPDAAGGVDFATDVLRDPWDMNTVGDVRDYANIAPPRIVFDGVSNTFEAQSTSGDPIVEFVNGVADIETRRYRNLTFALTLDTPFGLDGSQGEGSVARVLWGPQSHPRTTSQDIFVWPGRNVYTVDLSQLTATNGGFEIECLECPRVPWTHESVRYLRVDPHESTQGVVFRFGPVTLTAPDEVALGQTYGVEYSFIDEDAAGSRYEARIYIDSDRDASSKRQIDTITDGVTPGSLLRYAFNPAAKGVSQGEYYVYLEIVETTAAGHAQARGIYSTGPIAVVGGPLPAAPNSPRNLSVDATGNDVAISWQPPDGGGPLTGYRIDVSSDATFSAASSVVVGDTQLRATATYPNGTWFLRVVGIGSAGIPGGISNIVSVTLPTDVKRRGNVRRPPP